MEFFNSAVDVLKTLVVALGAGLGVWVPSSVCSKIHEDFSPWILEWGHPLGWLFFMKFFMKNPSFF